MRWVGGLDEDLVVDPININSIAGDAEVAEGTDGYATITDAEAKAGFDISGTTSGVAEGTSVTVTITSSDTTKAPVEVTTTVKEDGTWTANVAADALTVSGGETFTVVAKTTDEAGTDVTDTDITAAAPTVSITVDNAVVQEKDSTMNGAMTYTVKLSEAAETDTTVTIVLRQENTGNQNTVDIVAGTIFDATVPSALNQTVATDGDYILTAGDGVTLNGSTLTVVIPAGSTEATFTVDPFMEQELGLPETFGGEPNETVHATITTVDNNYLIQTAVAEGVIIDNDPRAIAQLTRDWSLQVGPSPKDMADTSGLPPGERVTSTVLMTNYDDVVYIGYQQNGAKANTLFGNITGAGNVGNAWNGDLTDDRYAATTVDMAQGDDYLRVLANQEIGSRVFLGEGNDIYDLGNNITGGDGVQFRAYMFAEAGNDTFNITGNLGSGAEVYMGSGSDTVTVGGNLTGLLDLGSGEAMPATYLATYKDGTTSLGNDGSNTDLSTAINSVDVVGSVRGQVAGGAGQDTITVGTYMIDSTVNTGANNDSITINGTSGYLGGNWAVNDSYIDMGDGDDSFTVAARNFNSGILTMGAGADTVKLNALTRGNIYTGGALSGKSFTGENEDNTVDTVTIKTISDGTVNLGINDVLLTDNLSGGTVNFSTSDDTLELLDISGGTVNFGAGNDSLTVGSANGGTVNFGEDDDTLTITGNNVSSSLNINGGVGNDTVVITGTGNSFYGNRFSGVETIELGDNTLFIGNRSGAGLPVADDGSRNTTMVIKGDVGQVDLGWAGSSNTDLGAGWNLTATATSNPNDATDTNQYDVWVRSGLEGTTTLIIDTDIAII